MRYAMVLMLCLAVPALAEEPPGAPGPPPVTPDIAYAPSLNLPWAVRPRQTTPTPKFTLRTMTFEVTGQEAQKIQVAETPGRLYIGARELVALLGGHAGQEGSGYSVQFSWRDKAIRMWPGWGFGAYRNGEAVTAFYSDDAAFEVDDRFYFPLRTVAGAFGMGLHTRDGVVTLILHLPPETTAGPPAQAAQPTPNPPATTNDAGPADAKVFVRAFYPGIHECTPVRELTLGFAKDYPGKVRARFVPIDTPDGQKEWHDAGMNCGGVLVNGKQTFVIQDKDGAAREVTFKQRMGDLWKPEDLRAFVAAEVEKAYPK
jgi:hypothetical protein